MKKIFFILLYLIFLCLSLFSKHANWKNSRILNLKNKSSLSLQNKSRPNTKLASLTPSDGQISISNPKKKKSIIAGKAFKTELSLNTHKNVKNFEIWIEYDKSMVIPDKKPIKPVFLMDNSQEEKKKNFSVEFTESHIKIRATSIKSIGSGILFSIPWISLPDASGYENIGVLVKKMDDENSNFLSITADNPYNILIKPQARTISITCSKLKKIIKADKSFKADVRLDIGKIKVFDFEVWIEYDPYRFTPKEKGIRPHYKLKDLMKKEVGTFIFEENSGLIKIKGTSKNGISSGRFLSLTWNAHEDISRDRLYDIEVISMLDKYSNPVKPNIEKSCN